VISMNLYVDSAKIDEIKKSLELGYVHGITTNPTLLKKAEVWKESKNLRSFYSKILALCDGEVFVQIPSPSQAIAWASLDVDYVAIYFNRMEVAGINALENTKLILNTLSKSKTKVIAASVKTLEQLNSLVNVGIEYITIGYDLLEKLIESDSSQRDTKNFDEDMFNVMKNFSN